MGLVLVVAQKKAGSKNLMLLHYLSAPHLMSTSLRSQSFSIITWPKLQATRLKSLCSMLHGHLGSSISPVLATFEDAGTTPQSSLPCPGQESAPKAPKAPRTASWPCSAMRWNSGDGVPGATAVPWPRVMVGSGSKGYLATRF